MGKLTNLVITIAFLGAVASAGDYISINDRLLYRFWRKGAVKSIERTVSQLELKTLKHTKISSRYKNRITSSALSLEGELNKENYSKVQGIVEEKVIQNPSQYDDFATNIATSLVCKGNKKMRKGLYNSYPRNEKIELSIDTMRIATYNERSTMFDSWPKKERDTILKTRASKKAKETMESAKKIADEIKERSIEFGNWVKERYQQLKEKYKSQ